MRCVTNAGVAALVLARDIEHANMVLGEPMTKVRD